MSRRYRGTTPELEEAAIQLRCAETPAERVLWQAIRGRKLAGLKFRRQHPVGPYVLDFYCAERHLAIELDGKSHLEKQEYDQYRSDWLWANGTYIIRFSNDEVISDLDGVLGRIVQESQRYPSPRR